MRRPLALLALVLAGIAGPAAACINDNELPSHEREFRSQYGGLAGRSSDPSTRYPGHWVLIGTGSAMLIAAVAWSAAGGRARN